MLPHSQSDPRDRDRAHLLGPSFHRVSPLPRSRARPTPTLAQVRCFLSTPFAVLAFILVTAFFLYLIWNPLFGHGGVRVVHAQDLPHTTTLPEFSPSSLAGVLVDRADDLEEVSRWTSLSHHHRHRQRHQRDQPDAPDPSLSRHASPPFSCYGVHAQRGRRRSMEDTYAVYLQHQLHYSSAHDRHLWSVDTEEGESEMTSPWALFGVYDGHGGALASEYVAASLLPTLHSSLLHSGHIGIAVPLPPARRSDSPGSAENRTLTRCFESAFETLDEEFIDTIARPAGRDDGTTALVAGIYYRGGLARLHDEPDAESDEYQLVVANLGDCRAIMIRPPAHSLDEPVPTSSRSTRSRRRPLTTPDSSPPPLPPSSSSPTASAAAARPISIDHKPHLTDERAYIESHPSGFVTTSRRGPSRVQGVLAVSRAIGDFRLKPVVRNVPDVHIVTLDEEEQGNEQDTVDGMSLGDISSCTRRDECPFARHCSSRALQPITSDLLLLASDGFWDAVTNDEAARLTHEFLLAVGATDDDVSGPRAHDAADEDVADAGSDVAAPPLFAALASHLAKEAYLRGSMDNITVMVVHVDCIKRWLKSQVEDHGAMRTPLRQE